MEIRDFSVSPWDRDTHVREKDECLVLEPNTQASTAHAQPRILAYYAESSDGTGLRHRVKYFNQIVFGRGQINASSGRRPGVLKVGKNEDIIYGNSFQWKIRELIRSILNDSTSTHVDLGPFDDSITQL